MSNSINNSADNNIFKLRSPFLIGFLTNLLNPKAILFFISFFTVIISQLTPLYIKIIYGIWMVFCTGIWFCIVSIFFTSNYSKNFLKKYSIIISKIMGVILLLISIKVVI
tara:strand:- start:19526 stop:19855 length:330 start_codon:yes stop_codon:yes gene_type:complete